jgi:tRNA(Arg) A34 adenosine deaminase TadA
MEYMAEHEAYMRMAIWLAQEAGRHGNHPFGALLVKDGKVLLTVENTVNSEHDVTRHAELSLISQACRQFDSKTLSESTMYASTEPCAMCTAALYWAGIPRLVYGCPAENLGRVRNSPFVVPSRELLTYGRRQVEVIGPVLEEDATEVHKKYWK